ncbi:MAG: hypothetical protein HYX96_00745 [Chloroflexi bacterium]|nr:hypothetical protein [Chloroflexota bacterium]
MSKGAMRVLLASDQPHIRRCLERIIEGKLGGIVVGEGDNAIKTVWLARRLRPDAAIIDCYLPYTLGVADVPISRNSGLDAAQTISAEIPGSRVVLVSSLSEDAAYPAGIDAVLKQDGAGNGGGIARLSDCPGALTFARLEPRLAPTPKNRFSDGCVIVGVTGLISGLVLTATMVLAYIGLPLMVGGAVSLGVGCLGKLLEGNKETGENDSEYGHTGDEMNRVEQDVRS